MTREEFIEIYQLEDECMILEPWEDFKGGIVGLFYNSNCNVEGKASVICYHIYKIIMKLAFALMILLPLYFNYWK